jgi:hypothetical protein
MRGMVRVFPEEPLAMEVVEHTLATAISRASSAGFIQPPTARWPDCI